MPFDASDKEFLEKLVSSRVTPIATSVTNVEGRLLELEGKLAATEAKLAACEQIIKANDRRISAQDLLISAQQAKLTDIEKRLTTETEVNKTYRNLCKKLEGEIDGLEQYGRRYCARVFNIKHKENESEEELFTTLKNELKKVDYNLQRGDLVNFHRLGKVKKSEGKPDTQQVILKFQKWAPRKALYGINKKARRPGSKTSMRVHNDLTRRRLDTLEATKKRISLTFGESDEIYAYSDINSNIRVRCPDGSTIRINTIEEGKKAVREISERWEPVPNVYPGSNIEVNVSAATEPSEA